MSDTAPPPPRPALPAGAMTALTLGLVLIYVITGYSLYLGLRLTFLVPAVVLQVGFGMAFVLRYGRRYALAVGLGQALLTALISAGHGQINGLGVLGYGGGALVQALVGVTLLRGLDPHIEELGQRRQVLGFLLVLGLIAPLVGASADAATLHLAYGLDRPDTLLAIWVDLLLSKSAGLLIGSIAALSLIGRPREIWLPRRHNTALPLLIVALLLMLVLSRLPHWERAQQIERFRQDAEQLMRQVETDLQGLLAVMATTQGLLAGSPGLDAKGFADEAGRILRGGSRAPDFIGIVSRPAAGPVEIKGLYGQLALPRPAERAEWERRIARGLAQAAGGEALIADPDPDSSRLLMLRALDSPAPVASEMPRAVLLLAFDPGPLLERAAAERSASSEACLFDASAGSGQRRLAGNPGCARAPVAADAVQHEIRFGAERWMLRITPAGPVPLHSSAISQCLRAGLTLGLSLLTLLLLHHSTLARRSETLAAQRIGELRLTSLALRSHEERYRSVFDRAPVGVCICALDGSPLEANPLFCRLLDCTPATLAQRYAADAAQDVAFALQHGHAARQGLRLRRAFRQRDGTSRQVELVLTLLHGPGGEPEAVMCIAEDLSDQQRLESHERARHVAEIANRQKNEFLARMSHALRTPLTGMLGFTQLLQLRPGRMTPVQRSWVDHIGHASWHLADMIDDILDLARVESGELKVRMQRLDLRQLIETTLALHEPAATQRGVTLGSPRPAAALFVEGDPTRVQEILDNLISNAIKYNVTGGTVRVQAGPCEAGWIELRVQDTGPGLSAEQLGQLFQPFNRLGQEHSGIEGTGIGLVISRRLAERMNGSLDAQSMPGVGSCFTLRLQSGPSGATPAPALRERAPPGLTPPSGQRLVYIEDNPGNVELMEEVLRSREGLTLEVHADGDSGLAAVLAQAPAVLLLDMQLPGTDGLTLLRRLRAHPRGAVLPVIVISADAMPEHVREAMAAGATHYLTKPFVIAELIALVDRLLGLRPR